MDIKESDFVDKKEVQDCSKILSSDFSKFIELAEKHGITILGKASNKKLMNSDKKTYELLGIKNPKIKVLWEEFMDHSYYRCILLKDDSDRERVLAFSKTNIKNIDERIKGDIFAKEMPIGVLINKNQLENKRIVYLPLKVKSEKGVRDARAYIIKDLNGKIVFNIFEIFLENL
jgi:chorismate-pyruvate lyase